MTLTLVETSVQELKDAFAGEVILPQDDGYETARKVWNGMIDKRPAVIARCTGVADVIAAVNFARKHNIRIAVRGGGHNVAGFSTVDDGIIIDLAPMKGIWVDPEGKSARAEAGVLWKELDRETQAFGLATPGGLVSETGIAGLTLGGGIGWLMRKHGLTIDNLISAKVVTADGDYITASASENADLFWALRGGGGNFGIVTSFEYRLHSVGPVVVGGAAFYPGYMAAELLRFYADWSPPNELTTMFATLTAPPFPFIPAELQGKPAVAIAVCYAGPVEDGLKAVQPLLDFATPAASVIGPMPFTMLQQMFDPAYPKGIQSYWKTEYFDKVAPEAQALLVEQAGKTTSPQSQIHVQRLGGAIGRVDARETAFGRRDANFVANIVGAWSEGENAATNTEWVRQTWQGLQSYASGGVYLNFMDADDQARVRLAYGQNLYRLAVIKRKYDPENIFRLNQNIQPASQ